MMQKSPDKKRPPYSIQGRTLRARTGIGIFDLQVIAVGIIMLFLLLGLIYLAAVKTVGGN